MNDTKPRAPLERGASAVEYALLIVGIAAVVAAVVAVLGFTVGDLFDGTCDAVEQASTASTCGE